MKKNILDFNNILLGTSFNYPFQNLNRYKLKRKNYENSLINKQFATELEKINFDELLISQMFW